jgi:hypothetical protein
VTERQFRQLREGDLIAHRASDLIFLVTGNYGGRVTAVRTVDVTNAEEWRLARKVRDEAPEEVP